MGKTECLEFLSKMNRTGEKRFFTVKEIKKGLKEMGCSNSVISKTKEHCLNLWAFGFIEIKCKSIFEREVSFRIKQEN